VETLVHVCLTTLSLAASEALLSGGGKSFEF